MFRLDPELLSFSELLGWTHLFMVRNSTINPPAQRVGSQFVATNGIVKASADVFGASVTWDIA